MQRSYYRDLGDGRFASTELTQGAWNADEQHMAVATGLVVHALEGVAGGEGKRLARVSLDIFGLIHQGECEIATRVVRPGRRIDLIEAEWRSRGRAAIVARGWRLATEDTSEVTSVEDERLPHPDTLPTSEAMSQWSCGFIDSLEFRFVDDLRPGSGRAWIRTGVDLVEATASSTLARLMGLVDTANGIAPRVSPLTGWSFPNVDLQLHLHRKPKGEWLGLDVRQQYGPDGIGLTSAVLHDLDGPFGRSEQILLVRRGGH